MIANKQRRCWFGQLQFRPGYQYLAQRKNCPLTKHHTNTPKKHKTTKKIRESIGCGNNHNFWLRGHWRGRNTMGLTFTFMLYINHFWTLDIYVKIVFSVLATLNL